MNIEEAIEQLKSLKEHCKTMDDEIFKKDVEAIETLLTAYEKEKEKNKKLEYDKKFYQGVIDEIREKQEE